MCVDQMEAAAPSFLMTDGHLPATPSLSQCTSPNSPLYLMLKSWPPTCPQAGRQHTPQQQLHSQVPCMQHAPAAAAALQSPSAAAAVVRGHQHLMYLPYRSSHPLCCCSCSAWEPRCGLRALLPAARCAVLRLRAAAAVPRSELQPQHGCYAGLASQSKQLHQLQQQQLRRLVCVV